MRCLQGRPWSVNGICVNLNFCCNWAQKINNVIIYLAHWSTLRQTDASCKWDCNLSHGNQQRNCSQETEGEGKDWRGKSLTFLDQYLSKKKKEREWSYHIYSFGQNYNQRVVTLGLLNISDNTHWPCNPFDSLPMPVSPFFSLKITGILHRAEKQLTICSDSSTAITNIFIIIILHRQLVQNNV